MNKAQTAALELLRCRLDPRHPLFAASHDVEDALDGDALRPYLSTWVRPLIAFLLEGEAWNGQASEIKREHAERESAAAARRRESAAAARRRRVESEGEGDARRLLSPADDGRYSFEHGGTAVEFPTLSECGRFHYNPDDPSSERLMRDYGFAVWETGGGCTAWGAQFRLADGRDVHMRVTDSDGMSHEARPDGDTVVGVYDEDGEELATWSY